MSSKLAGFQTPILEPSNQLKTYIELKTEEGYSADIYPWRYISALCPHNISRGIYVFFVRCCADIVRTLCGHIFPGIYVRTISFLGFHLKILFKQYIYNVCPSDMKVISLAANCSLKHLSELPYYIYRVIILKSMYLFIHSRPCLTILIIHETAEQGRTEDFFLPGVVTFSK